MIAACNEVLGQSAASKMKDLLTYVRYIDHDESDMKEDILSVSELHTHTTSSEIFKVLNGFIEERGVEWKNCVGVCTDGTACLTGRN